MTILLYDYHELEEHTTKNFHAWKGLHITLFFFASLCGILNYTFLFETEHLVDNHCVFYPRKLEFHWVEIPIENNTRIYTTNAQTTDESKFEGDGMKNASIFVTDAQTTPVPVTVITENVANTTKDVSKATENVASTTEKATITKRETPTENVTSVIKTTVKENNAIIITENSSHRLVLWSARTLFPTETDTGCQFAEYMPLVSATFAIVWMTLFVICPSGGRSRHGITEPWSIIAPALVFSLAMVVLTGYSFTSTNSGLMAFCAAFHNQTNATTCSSVEPFLERSYSASAWWGLGARVAAARAAAAGLWAAWACAAALLLARCLTHRDFQVRRTTVHVVQDPKEKVIPHLKKQMAAARGSGRSRSSRSSPSKRDTVSARSEPTTTTELVTATVEHEDSQPTSLATTPLKRDSAVLNETEQQNAQESMEMTYNPQELRIQYESP